MGQGWEVLCRCLCGTVEAWDKGWEVLGMEFVVGGSGFEHLRRTVEVWDRAGMCCVVFVQDGRGMGQGGRYWVG